MTKGKLLRLILVMLCMAGILPASVAAQNTSFDNQSASVAWAVGNEEQAAITADIAGAVQYATVTTGSDLKVETATYFNQDMMKYTPGTSNAGNVESVMIEYRVKMANGVTFKPTSVNYDAVKVGTDGATFSYSYTIDGTEGGGTDVEATTVLRNNGANSATAQMGHTVDINADATNDFTFRFYISKTANNKNICISNVVINGVVNGKMEVEVVKFENEPANAVWDFNTTENYSNATTTPDKGFSLATVNLGDLEVTGTGTGQATNEGGDLIDFVKLKPSGATTAAEWSVKPSQGLTFTPTKVSMYIQRFGTDAENGVTITAKLADGTEETLGNFTAPRNNKTQAEDKYGSNANYTNQAVINLTEEQQEKLTSADGLSIFATIGVGNTKEGGFSDVRIEGLLNGEMAFVEKYTLTATASPEEGGTITVYPKADEYEANAEVQLTATENFGYHFANWTDAEGNVISEDAKFTYTMTANAELTANFKAVNTYELNYGVEGGANLYMVTPSPAPTVVDGKNMYEEGSKVTLTATSNPILTFTNWSNGETGSEIALIMNEDKTITAGYDVKDFVAAWDFELKGNDGRKADFYSENNDVAQLVLRTADGATSGWLDKSNEAAGGYEGRPGAVNWRTKGLGEYYWQTQLNCEAFTAISIKTAMTFNYNAYKTYNVEYSLDGETWTPAGSITIPGPKSWTDADIALPAECDNKAAVYIRWIADKSSEIDGTSSDNDGICLGATWIMGTANIVPDPIAPSLVQSVPAEGADNASANGKIVLTFDKKVKVAEGATATIGDMKLQPAVSGKTVIFEYKGLQYSTPYTFTLPANSVANLTDAWLAEPITVSFTTKPHPEVAKALYDFVVPDDGTFNEAVKAANSRQNTGKRFYIFVKDGSYKIANTEGATVTGSDGNTYPSVTTDLTASNVSVIGESIDGTVIYNEPTNVIEGLGKATTICIQKGVTNTYLQDIKLTHTLGDNGRVAVLQDRGDKTICKNVNLDGYQDTYYSNMNSSRFYFETSTLGGRVDFLCGGGDVVFNQCDLVVKGDGAKITAAGTPAQYGYVFLDCTIKGDSQFDGKFTLGRPWSSGASTVQYVNTTMEILPTAAGWDEMSGGWPAVFKEYNSHTATGTAVNTNQRKNTFGDGHQVDTRTPLTADEVALLTVDNVMGGNDDWDPTAATEQASAPTNVTISGTSLAWDDSKYVMLWAVCKNGKVVGFTTENAYEADDATAEWSVRAANEMGGLSEAAKATVAQPDGISNVNAAEIGRAHV